MRFRSISNRTCCWNNLFAFLNIWILYLTSFYLRSAISWVSKRIQEQRNMVVLLIGLTLEHNLKCKTVQETNVYHFIFYIYIYRLPPQRDTMFRYWWPHNKRPLRSAICTVHRWGEGRFRLNRHNVHPGSFRWYELVARCHHRLVCTTQPVDRFVLEVTMFVLYLYLPERQRPELREKCPRCASKWELEERSLLCGDRRFRRN